MALLARQLLPPGQRAGRRKPGGILGVSATGARPRCPLQRGSYGRTRPGATAAASTCLGGLCP
eukprot:12597451-Alexandrium_andersonii.AAC.1